MKKIAIMLLAALMLFAFVACNPDANDDTAADAAQVVADYIDALDKAQIFGDLEKVLAEEEVAGMTATAEKNVITVTFANTYANAAKDNTLDELKIAGTVKLTLTDSETADENATTTLENADGYTIEATNVTLEAKDTDKVELTAKAEGTVSKGQVLVNKDTKVTFTALKVGGTDVKETVDWEAIYKLTDNYAAEQEADK